MHPGRPQPSYPFASITPSSEDADVTDEPEEQPAAAGTPEPETADADAAGSDPTGSFVDLSDLPPPAPQVSLISDADLSWVDKPQKTDEELERREERKEAHKRKVRRRRRGRRALKITGVLFATFLVLALIWFEWTFSGLQRMPVAVGQAGLNTPGTTMLLVGANPEEPDAEAVSGTGWKHDLLTSDMVMLLHLTRDKRSMYVISIPADSLLPIPGVGEGRLSEAYQKGGQDLYVKTIESFTGVRLDHLAVMDMNALREITDALGGVVLDVPRAACGVPPGLRRLDGKQSLEYTALQDCMPRKDLDRVERQQSLVRALMHGAVDGGVLTHPFAVNRMLRATAGHLALEKGFSYPAMLGTLWSMRHLRTGNTTFLTVPVATRPLVTQDATDYVILDEQRDEELWTALREDRLREYVALHTDAAVLGP
jgi:LCP family protein required for cell wall assembly